MQSAGRSVVDASHIRGIGAYANQPDRGHASSNARWNPDPFVACKAPVWGTCTIPRSSWMRWFGPPAAGTGLSCVRPGNPLHRRGWRRVPFPAHPRTSVVDPPVLATGARLQRRSASMDLGHPEPECGPLRGQILAPTSPRGVSAVALRATLPVAIFIPYRINLRSVLHSTSLVTDRAQNAKKETGAAVRGPHGRDGQQGDATRPGRKSRVRCHRF